jgi:hypothetical protein
MTFGVIRTLHLENFNIDRHTYFTMFDHVNWRLSSKLIEKNLLINNITPNYNSITTKASDWFSYLCSEEEIKDLKNDPDTYIVFNFCHEGFSYKQFDIFGPLTQSGINHNIPGEKIIYLSGNLFDERVYQEWRDQFSPAYEFKVLSFNLWDSFVQGIHLSRDGHSGKPFSMADTCKEIHKGQYNFINLNRRTRPFRALTGFFLWTSECKENVMLSHDHLDGSQINQIVNWCKNFANYDLDRSAFLKFAKQTPFVVDRQDFEVNWVNTLPDELFQRSLISLVSETLHDSYDNTSMFFSEKSFRPMLYNHPIMIFGQPGCNKYFEKLGYANYDCYFDLSFDDELDDVKRLKMQVEQLEKLNKELNSMSKKQKYEWLMQGNSVLQHNKSALKNQSFNTNKLKELLDYIKQGY